MQMKRSLAFGFAALLTLSACSSTASAVPPFSQAPTVAPSVATSPAPSASTAAASTSPAPLAPDPAEAVIPNVEANAEITFWTFYLSPTFDDYIKETIARFQATYPGVKVDWEDHQATFQDDLKARPSPRARRPT